MSGLLLVLAIELGGQMRIYRDGCWQRETSGGSGGGWKARDSEAGCVAPLVVAELFRRAESLSAVPEAGAPPGTVTFILDDGRRVRPLQPAEALAQVSALDPRGRYARLPEPPVGEGPQLIAVSVRRSTPGGTRSLQALLSADGAWWCSRSIPATDDRLDFGKKPEPLAAPAALLTEVFLPTAAAAVNDREITVEVARAGGKRAPLEGAGAHAAAERFGTLVGARAPQCSLP